MLKTFVNNDKYDFLIKLLTNIYEDNLKETTSIIIIKGGYSSGKSTLMQIMKKLAVSSSQIHFDDIGIKGLYPEARKRSVAEWNSSLLFLSESDQSEPKFSDTLKKYHEAQKETGEISLYSDHDLLVKFNPGVFVCALIDNDNNFSLDNFEKVKRNPIELILPHTFQWDDKISPTLVEDCVEEFIRNNKGVELARRSALFVICILKFRRKKPYTPFEKIHKDCIPIIAKMVWETAGQKCWIK